MRAALAKSRRILITGLSTYWGGALARQLESDPEVETVIGVDSKDPNVELERTEFVRIGTQHSLIRRIVQAAQIDTVVDTRLTVDSVWTSAREAHENNAIGTMNIVTACDGQDSPVQKFVFKSCAHYYGAEQDDPAFFTEDMKRPHPPSTPLERDILEAENVVSDFGERNPDKNVTILRFANGLGPNMNTSHIRMFSLPVVPTILGFDPRYQFIHEEDIVGVLAHALQHDLPGVYNGAADGVLALSEVIDALGKQMAPVLPPWGTGLAARPLTRLGLRIPTEMLNQMRYGRALDNRRLKATGYDFRYTTREAVIRFREHQRLEPLTRSSREPYRYEREVEEFLRWSPSVRQSGGESDKRSSRPSPTQIVELQKVLGGLESEGNVPPRRSEPPSTSATSPPAAPRSAASRPAVPRPSAPGPAPGATRPTGREGPASPSPATRPVAEYDALPERDVIVLLPSLERSDLEALARHEAAHRARPGVLAAIERILASRRSAAGEPHA